MKLLFGLSCLCKKINAGEGSVCCFAHGGDMFPIGTMILLKRSSGLQEAYTKACPNSSKKLPLHVGAMSWHHAMFHDFQSSFGFMGILKPSLLMFPAEPRCPDVWISFAFLAWDLEIHPRTHMWFFKQLWCTGARACSSNLNYTH